MALSTSEAVDHPGEVPEGLLGVLPPLVSGRQEAARSRVTRVEFDDLLVEVDEGVCAGGRQAALVEALREGLVLLDGLLLLAELGVGVSQGLERHDVLGVEDYDSLKDDDRAVELLS